VGVRGEVLDVAEAGLGVFVEVIRLTYSMYIFRRGVGGGLS